MINLLSYLCSIPLGMKKSKFNNPDIRLLIINTISMKYSETEALRYLTDKGYSLTNITYRRIKHHILDDRTNRLNAIANNGYIDAHLDTIDNLNHIKREMWIQYDLETRPYAKVEILTQIANLEPYLSEYYALTKKVIEDKARNNIKTLTNKTGIAAE
jgi:hypothetical protein